MASDKSKQSALPNTPPKPKTPPGWEMREEKRPDGTTDHKLVKKS